MLASRRWLLSFLVLLFCALMAILSYLVIRHAFVLTTNRDISVVFNENESVQSVWQKFETNGVLVPKYIFFFTFHFHTKALKKYLVAGHYKIPKGSSTWRIMRTIFDIRNSYIPLTIPEGYTMYQVLEKIRNIYTKGTCCTNNNVYTGYSIDEEIRQVGGSLSEGSVMPDTYFIFRHTKPQTLLSNMSSTMKKFLDKAWKARDRKIDQYIRSPQEALILASIIEKEAIANFERGPISGVYFNRLMRQMRLQADPTVIYGITYGRFSIDRGLLFSDLADRKNKYNTYRRTGLPPTPICNPGRASILAALHPTNHDYYYFIYDNDKKKHIFTKTFEEHLLIKHRLQKAKAYGDLKTNNDGSAIVMSEQP